ncbi:MlaD family protein [Aldersonia kunmingensis]|uniref:MlaD family protein n=1 Tax=Aldersonia kunmingensis TaxID=408066 RepID=UPI0012ECF4BF|nr:MlaD family protein [Aldersonia kunmingensis]
MRLRRTRIAVLGVAAAVTVAGCGFNPSDYAMPGSGVSGPTYRLNVEFESLLSLPAGAAVRSGGTKVGSLSSIELAPQAAIAHIDVGDDVQLPVGTHAELRQTTVLGDIYLALLPPTETSGVPLLGDGDTIPLSDTDTGPQIEQILQRVAEFVNGGSVTRLQDAVAQLNEALPSEDSELRTLASDATTNLQETSTHIPDLERIVSSTEALSVRLNDMRDQIGFLFSPVARSRLGRVPYFMDAVLNVVIDVNTLTTGLDWLIPRLPHINEALEKSAVVLREPSPSQHEIRGNAGELIKMTQNDLIPFLLEPGIDVRQISIAGNKGNSTSDAMVLLRMIGVLR